MENQPEPEMLLLPLKIEEVTVTKNEKDVLQHTVLPSKRTKVTATENETDVEKAARKRALSARRSGIYRLKKKLKASASSIGTTVSSADDGQYNILEKTIEESNNGKHQKVEAISSRATTEVDIELFTLNARKYNKSDNAKPQNVEAILTSAASKVNIEFLTLNARYCRAYRKRQKLRLAASAADGRLPITNSSKQFKKSASTPESQQVEEAISTSAASEADVEFLTLNARRCRAYRKRKKLALAASAADGPLPITNSSKQFKKSASTPESQQVEKAVSASAASEADVEFLTLNARHCRAYRKRKKLRLAASAADGPLPITNSSKQFKKSASTPESQQVEEAVSASAASEADVEFLTLNARHCPAYRKRKKLRLAASAADGRLPITNSSKQLKKSVSRTEISQQVEEAILTNNGTNQVDSELRFKEGMHLFEKTENEVESFTLSETGTDEKFCFPDTISLAAFKPTDVKDMSNFVVPSKEDTRRIQQFIAQKVHQFQHFAQETMACSTGNEETIIPDAVPTDTPTNEATQSVKSEQDKELNERARKIRETNAKKMAAAKKPPEKTVDTSEQTVCTASTDATGQFGWETIEAVYVPYFLVGGEKFVSKRIIFDKIFKNISRFFNEHVFSCIRWNYTFLTHYEAEILNDINCNHSDSSFGAEKFTTKDFKTSHDTFMGAYEFVLFCYAVLILKDPTKCPTHCGFVRINQDNIVPYIVRDTKKYVPMFYFETNSGALLDTVAIELSNIEMFYLRFCCKVQEIKKQFYEVNTCRALEIEQVCNLLPPNSTMVDYWPVIDTCAFLKPEIIVKPPVSTPQHVAIQPSSSTTSTNGANTPVKPVQNYNTFKNGAYKNTAVQNPATGPNNVKNDAYKHTAVPNHATGPNNVKNGACKNTAAPNHATLPNNVKNGAYTNTAVQNPAIGPNNVKNGAYKNPATGPNNVPIAPRPVVPAAVSRAIPKTSPTVYKPSIVFVGKPPKTPTYGSALPKNGNLVTSTGTKPATTTPNSKTNNTNKTNQIPLISLKGVSSVIQVNKLPPILLGSSPYRVITKMLFSKSLTCINLNANDFSDFYLAAVDDIAYKLFPSKSLGMVESALKYMGLDFYKLNEDQVKAVKKSHHLYRPNEWFVLYQAFLDFLPQITYMVENKK